MPIILPGLDAGLPMSFVELQDEVIRTRFNESQRASVCRWINWRYQWVNSQAEWPWLSPSISTLSWTGLAETMVMNELAYRQVREVWDDDNDVELTYLSLDDFLDIYGDSSTNTGDKVNWSLGANTTPNSGLLYLGPQAGAVNLKLVGQTRPALLAGDDDLPVWPSAWHFALVLGATSTGLKLENDPTWEALETEFLASVELMKEELLPPHQPEPRQFGRQAFDVWA